MSDPQSPTAPAFEVKINDWIGTTWNLFKRVFERIKSQYGMLVVWYLLLEIIACAGFVACCIGAFVTSAFMILALSVSYLAIFKAEAPAAQQ